MGSLVFPHGISTRERETRGCQCLQGGHCQGLVERDKKSLLSFFGVWVYVLERIHRSILEFF